MRNKAIPFIAIVLLSFASCRNGDKIPSVPTPVESNIKIELKDGYWIYYNISEAKIVGESEICNAADDSEWYARLDWDIAFSEVGIRTNSGTSGHGQGGIRLRPVIPDTLELSEYEEYQYLFTGFRTDSLNIPTIVPLHE